MKKIKKCLAVLIIIVLIICLFAVTFNTSLATRYYIVKSDKIHSDVRIAFVADLHSCNYGEGQQILINKINEKKPDLVLLGGDIVDDLLPTEKAEEFLAAISKLYPCYYVSGNHEYWSGKIDNIKKMIVNYGIIILEGKCKKINLNGQEINICGIDDPEVGNEFSEQLANCAISVDSAYYTILLSHRPEYIDEYLKYDFDLILSGHTHGGLWRLPGIINGLYAPGEGWFPRYAGGLYYFDSTSFIVSRGLAKESTRIPRIFNRPEIVIIDIKPNE